MMVGRNCPSMSQRRIRDQTIFLHLQSDAARRSSSSSRSRTTRGRNPNNEKTVWHVAYGIQKRLGRLRERQSYRTHFLPTCVTHLVQGSAGAHIHHSGTALWKLGKTKRRRRGEPRLPRTFLSGSGVVLLLLRTAMIKWKLIVAAVVTHTALKGGRSGALLMSAVD